MPDRAPQFGVPQVALPSSSCAKHPRGSGSGSSTSSRKRLRLPRVTEGEERKLRLSLDFCSEKSKSPLSVPYVLIEPAGKENKNKANKKTQTTLTMWVLCHTAAGDHTPSDEAPAGPSHRHLPRPGAAPASPRTVRRSLPAPRPPKTH